jgi:hypothetical protein
MRMNETMRATWTILTCLVLAGVLRGQDARTAELPRLDRAVKIICVDGILKFEWLDEQVAGVSPLTVQGAEARWRVGKLRSVGPDTSNIALDRISGEASAADHYWNVSITTVSGQIRISANRGGKTPRETRVLLTQRADGLVRVMVVVPRAAERVDLSAANLLDLRIRHPRVFNEAISPLLEQLGQPDLLTPGATDVYRMFDDISPDERTMAAVSEILPRLSSPSFIAREAATEQLRRLGPVAILVLVHVDLSDLTPEAQSRIELLLQEQTRRRFDDPKAMRNDVAFLADCLEFNDERVRTAAMARIEQLTGWKVPPADWAHPGDYIRGKLAQKLKSEKP